MQTPTHTHQPLLDNAAALRAMTHGLRDMHMQRRLSIDTPPNHRAILRAGINQSTPFQVVIKQPSTGRDA